jgi:RNA-directed DNA polymerase
VEQRGPAAHGFFDNTEGRGEMIKAPINLQDLRRRIYVKAKAEPSWRFWGLYVHVCKMETLRVAYAMAKNNKGAPGVDGVTFETIEAEGVESFLEHIRDDLARCTYRPLRARKVGIPKAGGKVRQLLIPTIRDRVVQGALKLILEPVFEADFQPGSFGYRPRKSPNDALQRVSKAILQRKTQVIDFDLRAYFDSIRHDVLLEKVAKRIDDNDVMRLLRMMLKASGKRGVPQGGVLSPLLSNVYLNQVDEMLERAKEVTRYGRWGALEYARFADDLVVLVDFHPRQWWLRRAVQKRLREEFSKLGVELNEEKSRVVDLSKRESFGFLGFKFRLGRSRAGRPMPLQEPQIKKRTALLRELKEVFRRSRSQPVQGVIATINPVLRGWVNYFGWGNASRCFRYVRLWVEQRIRRHLARACKRQGFGWKRWSSPWLYDTLGLFDEYRLKYKRCESGSSTIGLITPGAK